jgi:uncharacterized protein YndB with AHSA1/START domain
VDQSSPTREAASDQQNLIRRGVDAPPALVLSRRFRYPRARVFEAWTKAEHVAQWFTPAPLVTSACEVDLRPGGVFRIVMRMPNGEEHALDATFVEVVAPERIVFRGSIPDGNVIETTVTFEDHGAETTLGVRQTYSFASPATQGAPQGWAATLDQLGAVVARLAGEHHQGV